MGRELKMKNVELRITSHSDRHPEDTSEGSAQLNNFVGIPGLRQADSLSPLRRICIMEGQLRMTFNRRSK